MKMQLNGSLSPYKSKQRKKNRLVQIESFYSKELNVYQTTKS